MVCLTFPCTIDIFIPSFSRFSLISGFIKAFCNDTTIIKTLTDGFRSNTDHCFLIVWQRWDALLPANQSCGSQLHSLYQSHHASVRITLWQAQFLPDGIDQPGGFISISSIHSANKSLA